MRRIALGLAVLLSVLLAFMNADAARAETGDHILAFPWKFNQTAYITQGYNQFTHTNGDKYALDLGIPGAGEIRAAASGLVAGTRTGSWCASNQGYGNYIDIKTVKPDGQVRYYARYAHLSTVSVTASQIGVYRGQKIGVQGDTGNTWVQYPTIPCGPHLHFRLATSQDCSSSTCAVVPEKMSGEGGFATGQPKTSDNFPYKADFSGDGCADILSTSDTGYFYLTRGKCDGTLLGASTIGSGWNVYTKVITGGDFESDGCADILSTKGDGTIWLTRGNCQGGWRTWPDGTWSKVIGNGWNIYNDIFGPADFSGDDCPDVLSTKTDGTIWLTRGDCYGGWLQWSPGVWSLQIGSGWNIYNRIIMPGDFTGDGCSDVLSTKGDGSIWLTRGNCASGWLTWSPGVWSIAIGSGWNDYVKILAPGDMTAKGCADVASTKTNSSLWLTQGSCDGAFWLQWSPGVWSKMISGSGWAVYRLIF
jgi:hypothetical protein